MYRIKGKNKITRWLILLFLLSIIFDGVFRKWLLVPFSTQLMMVKELIAIIICVINFNMLKLMTSWEKSFIVIGFIAFFSTLLFGHQNLEVAIYGCLPYWFGIPLCFIIGKRLQSTDLLLIVKFIVYTGLANSILMIIQFNLSPSHILNYRGGLDNIDMSNMVVSEMAGMFRPSGLFIHSTQSNLFMLLNFCILLYLLISNTNLVKKKNCYSWHYTRNVRLCMFCIANMHNVTCCIFCFFIILLCWNS